MVFFLPRKDAHSYPLDLDGSLRYTRPYSVDIFPYPPLVRNISGILAMQDAFVLNNRIAKTPFGPNVNRLPVNYDFQIAVAGLTKVSPR